MEAKPITLGDKLTLAETHKSGHGLKKWFTTTLFSILNVLLMAAIIAVPLWFYMTKPELFLSPIGSDTYTPLAAWIALITIWLFVFWKGHATKPHPLLAHDKQGFMRELRLDAKTAVFDGSNIYHFGHENGRGALPLKELVKQLRIQGYRIVCFFDANIFFTLSEHSVIRSDARHSLDILKNLFRLEANEIYVVPSGVQADEFILETLENMPLSFAVTNDRFRDYAPKYPKTMASKQWRKGVVISNNELKLLQHRLPEPIKFARSAKRMS